ncbi:hypothetical protein WJX77_000695 [Trebouxia sp. C0004]
MVDAQGNPAEPYMVTVVSRAADSTMDSMIHARVQVKVSPEPIPEVCKDEGLLCDQLPQSAAQPHTNSTATIEEREQCN